MTNISRRAEIGARIVGAFAVAAVAYEMLPASAAKAAERGSTSHHLVLGADQMPGARIQRLLVATGNLGEVAFSHEGLEGFTLDPAAAHEVGRILNPKDQSPTSPNPLRMGGDFSFYGNYDAILGGNRKDGDGRGLMENGYKLNAESDNLDPDFRRNFEGNPYAVVVWQGQEVEVPGLGHLTSRGGNESVVMTWVNFDKTPIAWRPGGTHGPVLVKAGFIAKGNVVDGSRERGNLEERHLGYWVHNQFSNNDYPGITGRPEQAQSVVFASFAREGGVNRLVRAGRIDRSQVTS